MHGRLGEEGGRLQEPPRDDRADGGDQAVRLWPQPALIDCTLEEMPYSGNHGTHKASPNRVPTGTRFRLAFHAQPTREGLGPTLCCRWRTAGIGQNNSVSKL